MRRAACPVICAKARPKARLSTRLLLLALCGALLFSLCGCADMGAGDSKDAFYKYFSHVYLISSSGLSVQSIKNFNESITMENSSEVKEVVEAKEYRYIAFRVASEWTLTVDEFAFFFKGAGTAPVDGQQDFLIMDFFISDTLPSKIRFDADEKEEYLYLPMPSEQDTVGDTDGVYTPETDTAGGAVDRTDEVDESIFDDPGYARGVVTVTPDWDSVLLSFDTPQVVKGGQYIVVRINNNCEFEKEPDYSDLAGEGGGAVIPEPVSFTFNYLMFHFNAAQKA